MLEVVATPIGNISDITLRALDSLRESEYILAEDTRRTRKLLSHYDIHTKIVSYNEHNKFRKTDTIITALKEGTRIAMVTDSGTPCISDPGDYLVRECHNNNIVVSPVPGPSAFVAALSASGMKANTFAFHGFVPKKKKKSFFENFQDKKETIILYESPYRINKTLTYIAAALPNHEICLARELTKKFEEFQFGKASELQGKVKDKGEFVIIMQPPKI